jgi:hypothetical protein
VANFSKIKQNNEISIPIGEKRLNENNACSFEIKGWSFRSFDSKWNTPIISGTHQFSLAIPNYSQNLDFRTDFISLS